MKYTKEIMEKACIGAKSIAQVCRNLGLKPVGGNYKTVKNNLDKFVIDITHFTGQRWNKGLKHVEETSKIPLENILKENINYKSSLLKERLINAGIKESKCELCGYTENLELHHIMVIIMTIDLKIYKFYVQIAMLKQIIIEEETLLKIQHLISFLENILKNTIVHVKIVEKNFIVIG